jgi:hypothetical protein
MNPEAAAFKGKLQGVGVRDQCFKVGSKYEIFSLAADSPCR